MNDIWVCDTCKSINRMRVDACYHCRAPRSGAMETPGLDLRAESAALERRVRTYVASWPLALVTAVLLVAVALLGLVILKLTAADYPAMKQAFVDAMNNGRQTVDVALVTESPQIVLLSLVRGGLTLLALLCFAGWLALVTRNVPLLGGGTPSRSPTRVFVYALIPIWNLIKVPGMVQDLLYRVDARAGGAFMVLAAWIGLVGSYLVSIVGSWTITAAGIRSLIPLARAGDMGGLVKGFGEILDQLYWLGVIVAIMVAAGTILLAVIMLGIESRATARDAEIRAQMAASGAPTPGTGPDWPAARAMQGAPREAPSAPGPTVTTPASIGPTVTTSGPYEPDWPAGRPWPGSPGSGPSGTPSPDKPSPLPPPPPPDAPRLG